MLDWGPFRFAYRRVLKCRFRRRISPGYRSHWCDWLGICDSLWRSAFHGRYSYLRLRRRMRIDHRRRIIEIKARCPYFIQFLRRGLRRDWTLTIIAVGDCSRRLLCWSSRAIAPPITTFAATATVLGLLLRPCRAILSRNSIVAVAHCLVTTPATATAATGSFALIVRTG